MHANMGIVASSVWVRKGMKDSYGKLSGKKNQVKEVIFLLT